MTSQMSVSQNSQEKLTWNCESETLLILLPPNMLKGFSGIFFPNGSEIQNYPFSAPQRLHPRSFEKARFKFCKDWQLSFDHVDEKYILTLSPPNHLSYAKFLVCFNFQSASKSPKLVKISSECQTAWIWVKCRVRRLVTPRLIQIQAVCIWHYSCEWRPKG